MANNKMLIDAGHPEETRVVMVRGNRVDEFDFESEHKKQLRGNIYLAKVTRVEPSLQAAFVDYGGNRHGFLAFSEIHPDYYQIPVADRQALLEAEEESARRQAEAESAVDSDDIDDEIEAADEDEIEEEERPARKRRSRRRRSKSAKPSDDNGSDDAEDASDEESDDSDEEMMADNDGDDVVSEPASEEPKPKKRTRRKKAENEDGEPEEKPKRKRAKKKADEEASDESDEEKPKRKRRTKAKAEAAEADETSDEAEEKPKRKRRSKKSDTEAGEAEAEAKSEDEETDEKPKRKRRSKKSDKKDEETAETNSDEESGEDTGNDEDNDTEDGKRSSRRRSRRGRGRGRGRRSRGDANDVAEENGEVIDAADADADVDSVGASDALEEVPQRRVPRRQYKIQEVVKRRQVMLVQVVKEERGNKGAALTTYLSLAGRYSVLMPNTARGGGISRKITNAGDRRRLKAIAAELDVPKGMGVILRTAGAAQDASEVQRDFEYLLRLWENVRTLTLESTAPCLVYEEGSLIKRSIRDMYDKDTKEIIVAGDEGYKEARDFMEMLMPDQVDRVKLYRDRIPMFAKLGVEGQLDAMLQPQVTLKSGGYLVLNQTEALVAIDVNSGRSTRQHSIEETATQTNLEAADEIARQLRLRDLAGLIVIDFIDMEDRRNNRAVEKRLKDALQQDRARIQVGRISHFGLLEMSRQRIRASVLESTTQVCPTCEGLGHVRSASSVVLSVLRQIEESLNRSAKNNLVVKVSAETALYLLNNKREHLSDLEQRFGVSIDIEIDPSVGSQGCAIEKGDSARPRTPVDSPIQMDTIAPEEAEGDTEAEEPTAAAEEGDDDDTGEPKRRRRRRRRGGKDAAQDDATATDEDDADEDRDEPQTEDAADREEQIADEQPVEEPSQPAKVKRRRRRSAKDDEPSAESDADENVEAAAEPVAGADEPPRAPRRRTSREGKIDVAAAAAAREERLSEERAAKAENAPSEEEIEALKAAEPPRRARRRTSRIVEDASPEEASESTSAAMEDEEAAVQPAEETPSAEESGDDGEKKSGWWRRRFF